MTLVQENPTGRLAAPSAPAQRKPRRRGIRWQRALAWVALAALVLLTLFPFYWMLRISLSDNRALAAGAGSLLPADLTFGAFRRVLGLATLEEARAQGGSGASIDFWRYLWNSVLTSSVITVGQVLFSAMAAYAFARLRWPGREAVFFAFLTALMIPPIFTALPNFVLMQRLGLLNTYAAIILPFFFMTPFAVFFLRQFFLGLSREIEEAAKIDGAGHVRIFFRIILPMSAAPLSTLALLVYITSWNEYFWPLLVGQEEDVRVLTVALGIFRSQTPQGSPDWAGLMAATLLAALPMIALFAAFGRRIVDSIQFSGLK
ncbi:multiple sugar transport system permease protein [Kineococcus xinjiangensis]|uniref:Multiple sugar transport system permease protein n=1 Tax=Kineococcus xinjiangensis TaxID=512762 RepID=A0A2S6IWM2_9ACTN|nr:carbohydrate ABC transporter permease [Kineococcus xinjiangensis]PPK98686.1 multiple sugar transport system permease protein [Kineococcus xinjiangensis]